MDEYLAFAKDQMLDFTDEDKASVTRAMTRIEERMKDQGYILPKLDPIVFVKSTMEEELGADGVTHGTQIYLSEDELDFANEAWDLASESFTELVAHEIFHCITRSSPKFRSDVYKIIHFTVQDQEYELPPCVREYFISNPDVEHHNAWAPFIIHGQETNCFTAFITSRHFENEGETFFDTGITALIPTDGSDVYYTESDAENFWDIFGRNTTYVIDPEECMADNFSLLISAGPAGKEDKPPGSPEILEALDTFLKNGTQ